LGNGAKRVASVCPGPNIAYFSKIATLKEMMDHIYGRGNLLNGTYRPNMFIKDVQMYIEFFMKEVKKALEEPTEKQRAYWNEFKNNLLSGIEYYRELFPKMVHETEEFRAKMLQELEEFKIQLDDFITQHLQFFSEPCLATSV